MKTSSTWNYRFVVGKIMLGLIFAVVIGNMDASPALGKDNHKNMGNHDNGRYDHGGRGYGRDRYEQRGHGYARDRYGRVYRPYGYGYRERGYYAPPPVIYAPLPPPGISIFFPPLYIHP